MSSGEEGPLPECGHEDRGRRLGEGRRGALQVARSISNLADRVADAGPAAVVLVAATLALLAIPLLGRLAARGQHRRGGPARLFLGLAVVLSLAAIAIGTMG